MKYLKNTLAIIGGLCIIPIIIALGYLLMIICAFIVIGVVMLLQLGFIKVILGVIGIVALGFIILMVIVVGYAITLQFLETHFKFFNKK